MDRHVVDVARNAAEHLKALGSEITVLNQAIDRTARGLAVGCLPIPGRETGIPAAEVVGQLAELTKAIHSAMSGLAPLAEQLELLERDLPTLFPVAGPPKGT